jgi:hypothetical protein
VSYSRRVQRKWAHQKAASPYQIDVRAFGKNGVALTAIIHLTVFALNLSAARLCSFVAIVPRAHKAHAKSEHYNF